MSCLHTHVLCPLKTTSPWNTEKRHLCCRSSLIAWVITMTTRLTRNHFLRRIRCNRRVAIASTFNRKWRPKRPLQTRWNTQVKVHGLHLSSIRTRRHSIHIQQEVTPHATASDSLEHTGESTRPHFKLHKKPQPAVSIHTTEPRAGITERRDRPPSEYGIANDNPRTSELFIIFLLSRAQKSSSQ